MGKAPRSEGLRADAYKSTGRTRDGVRVVAPKTKPKNFTEAQLKRAVAAALRELQVHAAKPSLATSGSTRVEPRKDGKFSVKKPGAKRASAVKETQKEAVARARELDPGTAPIVKRVRKSTGGRKGAWRKA